ncbi:hypothetical protein Vadar_011053 [Vaccinium darrowii]|uniref:Uncharacterized protein n=1 Tax=Vaccinium darrowii TaxID=229202 RepID=A0ACB7Z2X2_9ERIC|nr:hypothetical protein Vadar_011053 [Vaccinium darrowii]
MSIHEDHLSHAPKEDQSLVKDLEEDPIDSSSKFTQGLESFVEDSLGLQSLFHEIQVDKPVEKSSSHVKLVDAILDDSSSIDKAVSGGIDYGDWDLVSDKPFINLFQLCQIFERHKDCGVEFIGGQADQKRFRLATRAFDPDPDFDRTLQSFVDSIRAKRERPNINLMGDQDGNGGAQRPALVEYFVPNDGVTKDNPKEQGAQSSPSKPKVEDPLQACLDHFGFEEFDIDKSIEEVNTLLDSTHLMDISSWANQVEPTPSLMGASVTSSVGILLKSDLEPLSLESIVPCVDSVDTVMINQGEVDYVQSWETFQTVDPRISQKLMMDQHSLLCYAAILLLFFASPIGSSSLIANANVSTLWINKFSWSDTPFLSVNFKPILSTGNRFSFGFYCDIYHPKTACLLAVVIYAEESAEESIGSTMSYSLPQLVWSANRNHPVKRNATLQLTRDGDLVLADADGTFVWSANTSGKSVSGLDLTEHGNLVLFDRNNTAVWQSFDHPTDCLVLGQTLVRGRKLIANISPSNWSEGLYSLLATRRELHAYIETNTPLTYYQGPKGSPKYENGSFSRFTFPFVLGAQFMRLESDGRLKVYEYRRYDWKVVADDLLTESGGECGYPMMCGKYGICSKGECVGCPDEANSKERNFRHVSYTQPNLGCSPVTPISCDQSQYHTLLELQNTSYFGFIPPNCDYYRNETTWHEEAEVEDCKKSCLSNCSCKAVLSVAAAYNSKPVLEMLCGRKNLDRSQPEEEMHLLGLFQRKGEEGQLLDMVDKYNADMQLHEAEVVEMMKVAVWCLQSDYQRRPSMTVVVQVLEGFVTVPDQLGYNFINAPARRTMEATGGDMDAIDDDGTPLLASVLSGPR